MTVAIATKMLTSCSSAKNRVGVINLVDAMVEVWR
jgi:hypothetical protein